MIQYLYNAAWILFLGFLIYRGFVIRSNRRYREIVRVLSRRRLYRISLGIIAFHILVGTAGQIRIPDEKSIVQPSILDLAFSFVEKERTYSAPFADRVTGVRPGTEHLPINQVEGVHLLGTDVNGYDVLLQLLQGSGTVLILTLGTIAVSFPVGVTLGMLAGYMGGRVDDLIQWLYTTVASIPWLLFVVSFLMVYGRGLFWICLAIGLTSWVDLARFVRGEAMKIKELDFVSAARASGISRTRILFRHIYPSLRYLVVITLTLSASHVILAESVLTFIGIGVQPGTASWGAMLVEAQRELVREPPVWWVFVSASFVGILPLVLSLNLVGDALRDALDPRLKGRR